MKRGAEGGCRGAELQADGGGGGGSAARLLAVGRRVRVRVWSVEKDPSGWFWLLVFGFRFSEVNYTADLKYDVLPLEPGDLDARRISRLKLATTQPATLDGSARMSLEMSDGLEKEREKERLAKMDGLLLCCSQNRVCVLEDVIRAHSTSARGLLGLGIASAFSLAMPAHHDALITTSNQPLSQRVQTGRHTQQQPTTLYHTSPPRTSMPPIYSCCP